ncbi:MAG TPA: TolC family protein [Puia sp.]|jgi:outer membrane protein|nr:TolC family protein [Puia sp.]
MSSKKLLLFFSIPVFLTYTATAQDKWDLKRCVEYAVANNISVKQADVQARLARLTLEQSRLNQIPTLNIGGTAAVNSGHTLNQSNYTLSTQTYFYNSVSATAGVTIFNGFSLQRTIGANRYAWQAMLANSEKLKNDISLNVANAYLQVLLDNQTAQTALLQMKLSQNQLQLTRKQVEAGTLPELNAAELESQVAQDSSSYITAKSNVVQAILNLKAYMDLDAATPFDVDTPPVDQIPIEQLADLQPDAVYTLALTHQPLQKMDALQVESDRQAVLATKGAMYPTVSLGGSLSSYYLNTPQTGYTPFTAIDTVGHVVGTNQPVVGTVQGVNPVNNKIAYFTQLNQYFSQNIGLTVNIPIFNNGLLRTNYNKSRLNLRNQELQRDQDNLTLKNNIYQAYTLAVAALEKFEANKITVAATAKSYDYAQKRYNVGMSNTIDLLTNQNNYFNAKVNLLYSQFDYVFKMKVLEYYKGMGIKL